MNAFSRKPKLLVIALLLLSVALCCPVLGAQVILWANPKNDKITDVFVRDGKSSKPMRVISVDRVDRNQYHAAEYRNGYVFIIRRFGDTRTNSSDWTDQLWRYSKDGKGIKIRSAQVLDFRVDGSGSRIAVIENNGLSILDKDGKLLKMLTAKDADMEIMDFYRWSGKTLWLLDTEDGGIFGLLRLNTSNMTVTKYNLKHLDMWMDEFALNTTTLEIVHSNYPMFLDVTDSEIFVKRKTPVKLWVYDLTTKHNKLVAKSIAKGFRPTWVGEDTIEYDNPKGKGRVRKTIH